MRWHTILIALCLPLTCFAQDPSVEILGVPVSKGMNKAYLSSVFPDLHCTDVSEHLGPGVESCVVSDGTPPGSDGNIQFKEGVVTRAYTNWFFPEGATPFEVALMLNEIMVRLVGENRAVCAKIEANPESFEGSMHTRGATVFLFPNKYLAIYLHSIKGESAHITEGLRGNPVPQEYEVYGSPHQGTEWCGYVNRSPSNKSLNSDAGDDGAP